MNKAVSVQNISKAYKIGLKEQLYDTFAGNIISWIKSPITNFKSIQQLDVLDPNIEREDVIWAVKNVSFELQYGEILGIIGLNGAGKSTLLKIISNITKPTTGRIDIYGRIASLLEVGTGFNQELTGRENIYLNGTILGMTKKEVDSKFEEIVDFSGVEKFIDTPVKRYSSGMKVRLAFAVAAHLDPEILIIDEVLAVGDSEFQKKCLGKMEDITKEGRTILFVSHNMSAIRSLCTRGILLKSGSVMVDGSVDKVVDEYLSAHQDVIINGVIPEDYPRNINKKGFALFKNILLKDEARNSTAYFSFHESIYIDFIIDIKQEIKDGIFVFLIGSSGEDRVSYSSTTDNESSYVVLPEGKHKISVKLNQMFLPGTYYITIALLDNQGFTYDSVPNVAEFHIGNIKNNGEGGYRWKRSLAQVNTEAEWNFENGISRKKFSGQ